MAGLRKGAGWLALALVGSTVFSPLAPAPTAEAAWGAVKSNSYQLDVIADTAAHGLQSIYPDSVSINAKGTVAFVGVKSAGEVIMAGDGSAPPREVSSKSSRVTYDYGIQINDLDRIVGRRRVSGAPITYTINIWDANRPGDWIFDCTLGRLDNGPFASLLSPMSINNRDSVVFSALSQDYPKLTPTLATPMRGCISSPWESDYNQVKPITTPVNPMVADNGSIVVRAGRAATDPIRRYTYDLQTATDVATAGEFLALGGSPGIADSGEAIAFYGDLRAGQLDIDQLDGPGVFLHVPNPTDELPAYARVALGPCVVSGPTCFQSFEANSRVAVQHAATGAPGLEDDSFVVTFLATPQAGGRYPAAKGLWATRLRVARTEKAGSGNGNGQCDPGETCVLAYRASDPQPVLQVGDTVSGQNVTDLGVYDPLANDLTGSQSHQIAFWAKTTAGELVLRARPFTLHSVEFTQAIQEWQNLDELKASLEANGQPPIPIVAEKPLVLRVYPETVTQPTDVTVEVRTTVTQSKTVTLQPPCTPDQRRRNDAGCTSIDFFLTPPEGDWDVTVTVKDALGNVQESHDFHFDNEKSNALIINAVSVCHDKDVAGNLICGDASKLPGLVSLLTKIAPTHEVKVKVTAHQVVHLISDYDRNRDGTTDDNEIDGWWSDVTDDLDDLHDLADLAAPGEHRLYYGVIHPSLPHGTGGMASGIPSNAAASRESVQRLGVEANDGTVAHEVSHALGVQHTNVDVPLAVDTTGDGNADPPGCYNLAYDPGTDWQYTNNQILSGAWPGTLQVGYDLSTRQVVLPTNHFEVMSYCIPRWVSPRTYLKMLDTVESFASLAAAASEEGEFWRVSGTFGETSVTLDPFFTVRAVASTGARSGSHRIVVRDAAGSAIFTRIFTPQAPHPETADSNPEEVPPSFSEFVPVQPGAASVAILDADGQEVASLALGGEAPSVTVDVPAGANPLSGTQIIQWTVSDPDSADHTFWVQYSPDGTQWITLASALGETSLTVNFDRLAASAGNAQIRVLASDGVNTGTGLSAAFAVAAKLPTAEILQPAQATLAKAGDLIWLRGFGHDWDDGSLDDRALSWESSLDGFLGIGRQLPVTSLSQGRHEITLTVTDSDGNAHVDQTTIVVGPPQAGDRAPGAPVADPGGPYTAAPGETVTFSGLGSSDPDGEDLTYTWDFGDGSTGEGAEPSHTYAQAGAYLVTLTVTDPNGRSDAAATMVTVQAEEVPPPDTVPPHTAAVLSGTPVNGWYQTPVTVTLNATDGEGGSGVQEIRYSLDGTTFNIYAAPIQVETEGTTTVHYYGIDTAGNQEATKTATIQIDLAPPVTQATLDGRDLTLLATDAASGVAGTEYSFDGGATWQAYSAPVTVPADVTEVQFRSTDVAGRTEAPRSITMPVEDAVAPVSSAAIDGTQGDNGWYTAPPDITLTATDNPGGSGVAEIRYTVGGVERVYTGPFAIAEEGIYAVSFYAVDAAGNAEAPKVQDVKIDLYAPVTNAEFSGSTLTLAAIDSMSGAALMEYSFDGDTTWQTYAGPVNVPAGVTTVHYRSTDAAGWVEAAKSITIPSGDEPFRFEGDLASGAAEVPADGNLRIQFVWAPGGVPTLNETAELWVWDQAIGAPVIVDVYGGGITYEAAAEMYSAEYPLADFGMAPGRSLLIEVFIDGELRGTATVDVQ